MIDHLPLIVAVKHVRHRYSHPINLPYLQVPFAQYLYVTLHVNKKVRSQNKYKRRLNSSNAFNHFAIVLLPRFVLKNWMWNKTHVNIILRVVDVGLELKNQKPH